MAARDIVAIGASAGGGEALKTLIRGLPPDIQATVFVVLHFPALEKSHLPAILSNVGALPAMHPKNGQFVRPNAIYVAPPDHHLLVKDDRIELSRGPKENHTRPAVNPLFRSVAAAYGGRVIGIILTGLLDDGTAGLIEIKRRGGIAIVQDPDDAMFSGMPTSALKHDHVDYSVRLADMAELVTALVRDSESRRVAEGVMTEQDPYRFTELTCPECRGPLS